MDQETIDAELRTKLAAARERVRTLEEQLLDAVEERDNIRILLEPTYRPTTRWTRQGERIRVVGGI